MKAETFLLRTYSIRRISPNEPVLPEWEVRAETDDGMKGAKVSLFYVENDPDNLPPVNAYIDVAFGAHPTEFIVKDQMPDVLAS